MEEIAATFATVGLPGGFHGAAADIFRRLEQYRDADPPPPVEEIIAALLRDRAAFDRHGVQRPGYSSGGSGQRQAPPAGWCGHSYAVQVHGT